MVALTRDGSAAHRLARRANALVLLDAGWSCERVSQALFVDVDTVRQWHGLYAADGFDGLLSFETGGSSCRMSVAQQTALKAWINSELPGSTRQVGAFIAAQFELSYESRAGLVALLQRIGCVWRKPVSLPRQIYEARQQAFIAAYQQLLTSMGPDEAVLFVDAVHPTHAARPMGCWSLRDSKIAIAQTSGRQRITIHGAIDLETGKTGKTRMIEALTADATSTLQLLASIAANHKGKRRIHVYLDNARHHHARRVREWLATDAGGNIRLHFLPAYCPHLNPIERLWGLMHAHVTHNKTYQRCADFSTAILTFLRQTVPQNWAKFCDRVTDNFRIISNKDFRVLS